MNGRTNVTTGANADDIVVPLDPITNFSVIPGNGFVLVQWTDPKDKYATPEGEIAQDPQQLVSEFDYTIVVRKIGSAPVDFKDGEVSVLSSVRNQYAESAYVDNGVTYDETYYYAAWVFNKDGIASDGVFADPVTPKYYDSVLANNTWDRINEACTNGLEQSLWAIGDEKDIDIDGEVFTTIIIDFNHDPLSDGSGNAAITFSLKNLMSKTMKSGLPTDDRFSSSSNIYSRSSVYSYINNTVYNGIENDLKNILQKVTKNQQMLRDSGGSESGASINVYLFTLSIMEVGNSGSRGDPNDTPYPYYSTNTARLKYLANGSGEAMYWWLRDTGYVTNHAFNTTQNGFSAVGRDGDILVFDTRYTQLSVLSCGICFGFCIGKSAA